MTQAPLLYVLRHGETEWNRARRFQGRMDSPLTAKGRAQAVEQGRILRELAAPPTTIFASPQGRAAETARIAAPPDADLRFDDRLQEVAFGAWEGVEHDHIRTEYDGDFDSYQWHFESPGGEDFDAIASRVASFLAAMTAPAIIVTHGVTSTVLRGLRLGLGVAEIAGLSREQGCVYRLGPDGETILR